MHIFKTEQLLPVTIEKAWDFFSTPANLVQITPPELDFKIKSELSEGDIYEGMTINYTVKPLLGIPVKWKTVLSKIIKYKTFTDTQIEGPYETWEHTHSFLTTKEGIIMIDLVKYKLPLGFLGSLINSLLVRNKIEEIFNFRMKVLKQLFKNDFN